MEGFLLILLLLLISFQGEDALEGGTRIKARVLRELAHPRRLSHHVPIQNTLHPDGGHLEKLRIELPLNKNQTFLGNLILNRNLLSEKYFERRQEGNESVVTTPTYEESELCHYHGALQGRPNSWVALSTCQGLRGVVFDGEETHYLEPVEEGRKEDEAWHTLHFHQGGKDEGSKTRHERVKRWASDHPELRLPFNSNSKSRYVELVMVVDYKKYRDLGANLKATTQRTKDIANIVNALYQPFNIFVALVGVVVWTEMDEITISSNGDETLSSFLLYRRERLLQNHPNDNAQLLTAVEFENGVVGKAMQGPMCSFKYSGGVNSDFRHNLVGIVATTVAHEMGHNFGLSHDQEDCHCPGNRCIMAASASSNRTSVWSSCSIKDMAYAFQHGMDYCLRNKPKTLHEGPTCGNGFTEPGEECDCGLPEHCDNPCCDAANCLMHDNATCAAGTCCDIMTCHVKDGGTPCRETSGLCDLPEYCTGESEFCPGDVKKLDGLECNTPNGQAYCYDGECRTHTDQCKLLWGPSGNNSDDLCYQRNSNGSRVAHCGFELRTEKYAQCRPADSACGVLHCQMNNEKLEYGYESAAILASFFVNAGGRIHPCRSVVVDFGLSDISPGMVPDGAVCGNEKMCVKQKCVNVSGIVGTLGADCGDCSGHGVCNSKGNCHCDDGYGGKLCEGSGYGGSIDSGPAYHRGTSRLLKALKVTVLGFIPLIAIITFYFYYANGSLKKLCMEIRRGGLLSVAQAPRGSPTKPKHPPPSASSNGHVSSPQPASSDTSPMGEDFFGNYKGFSLSPIKKTAPATPFNSNSNNNNHTTTGPLREEQILVKNEKPVAPLLKPVRANPPSNNGNNGRGVSWAQPIESRLPVSPPSEEEESNHSDTPLYDNNTPQNLTPTHNSASSTTNNVTTKPRVKKENSFSGLTSRLAAALPFIRNSLSRNSSSGGENGRRKKLDISTPILQTQMNAEKIGKCMAINPLETQPRYANIPLADESPTHDTPDGGSGSHRYANIPQQQNKPALKSMQRVRDTTPPPQPTHSNTTTPTKVQRAHSMIQPGNRNSVPNYNSLRRSRPTAPPPQPPPQAPPPPPPPNNSSSTPPRTFFKSSTPPPYNPNSTRNASPSSVRDSILKFSFGRSAVGGTDWLRNKLNQQQQQPLAPPPTSTARSNSQTSSDSGYKSDSTITPTTTKPNTYSAHRPNGGNFRSIFGTSTTPPRSPLQKEDNIYDTIDEGMSPHMELETKAELASSESSESTSPTNKDAQQLLMEKIDTVSTGSSENGGGLLSEIISEIKTRNRESIYNSVDRKKQKAKKKALANAAFERENCGRSPPTSRDHSPSSSSSNRITSRHSPTPPKIIIPTTSNTTNNGISTYLSRNNVRTQQPSLFSSSSLRSKSPTVTPPPYQKPAELSSTMTTTTTPPPPNKPTIYQKPSPPSHSSKPVVSQKPSPPQPLSSPTPKPTCAVNGIPKKATPIVPPHAKPSTSQSHQAATPPPQPPPPPAHQQQFTSYTKPTPPTANSYVAKINYFSNLTNTPPQNSQAMRPISSLPAPSKTTPNEIIYAPSNVNMNGRDLGDPAHLSTIRRSRPSSYLPEGEEPFVKKPGGGIYGSLGRKVATPTIRSKSVEREKTREEPPVDNISVAVAVEQEKKKVEEEVEVEYKPFNPYLNRPVTFSTFRPTTNNHAHSVKNGNVVRLHNS